MKLDHNRLEIVCVDQQNKNCLITDIACPCDKRVDIEQEINNKIIYSQQDLVSSSCMKILLVEDAGVKVAPFVLEHWVLSVSYTHLTLPTKRIV